MKLKFIKVNFAKWVDLERRLENVFMCWGSLIEKQNNSLRLKIMKEWI